jgi:branched-subunit amino acid aminotransferase/4-amino-4-deoxychorismate lyase
LAPRIKTLALSELQKADELFICNSLAGIRPVLSVVISPELRMTYVAGDITRQLQSELERVLFLKPLQA